MQFRSILTVIITVAAWNILPADDRATLREPRPLEPDSPDIVAQFHKVGLPKYNDIEKRIIDRARKLQDEHTAIFNKIEIGKSVFDYPGLITLGEIRHDPSGKSPYTLLIGIRPHHSEFADSFGEYRIEIDDKGIVQGKSKVRYSWNKAGQGAHGKPATRPVD